MVSATRKSPYEAVRVRRRIVWLRTVALVWTIMIPTRAKTAAATSVKNALTTTGAGLSLRRRLLLHGYKSYGPLLLSDSPIVAEMLAGMGGYGHVIVDHEHGPTDVRSGQAMLQAIQAGAATAAARETSSSSSSSSSSSTTLPFYPTEPIVRLPGHDTVYMKKVLDPMRLPGGVLVPMIEDAETATSVVRAVRYPKQLDAPHGTGAGDGIRGCAIPFVRGSAWGATGIEDYMDQCANDLLVMVQVETPKGVDAIPEIAAVDGVDGIFIGPFDLTCSMGKIGQFNDPDVVKMLTRAEESIVEHGRENDCILAGFRSPGRDLRHMFHDVGYSLVCGAVDLGFIRDAAKSDIRQGLKATKPKKLT